MKQYTYAIKIPQIRLFGYHGCYDEEKEKGQEFEIEVEIIVVKDTFFKEFNSLDDTIDYSKVESEIKRRFNIKRYDLLEQLASELATIPYDLGSENDSLIKEIASVSVKIRKNNPIGMSVPYIELKCTKKTEFH